MEQLNEKEEKISKLVQYLNSDIPYRSNAEREVSNIMEAAIYLKKMNDRIYELEEKIILNSEKFMKEIKEIKLRNMDFYKELETKVKEIEEKIRKMENLLDLLKNK